LPEERLVRPIKKLALLVDGGCLRAWANQTKRRYEPELIEAVAHACVSADEELFRILYYDCDPFSGSVDLPLSGTRKVFAPAPWLHKLEGRDLFAVRRGVLKFRGWDSARKTQPATTDADFEPRFEQKGVDMRIGLDIANYSVNRIVDRLAVLTADTDMVPAFKFARQSGLQVVLISMEGCRRPTGDLIAHVDYHRSIKWPTQLTPSTPVVSQAAPAGALASTPSGTGTERSSFDLTSTPSTPSEASSGPHLVTEARGSGPGPAPSASPETTSPGPSRR
jgi:uncharacterized LabA/DUF88 family protein